MTREEAIEELWRTVHLGINGKSEEAFETIKELLKQTEWHTAPPTKEGKYLVHYTYDCISTARYSNNLYKVDKYDFQNKHRAGWYNYDSEYGYYEETNIEAWMPIPKYEKERE